MYVKLKLTIFQSRYFDLQLVHSIIHGGTSALNFRKQNAINKTSKLDVIDIFFQIALQY